MTLLLAFLLLALIVSFACSMWESVLLSVTPSYVARAQAEGRSTGRLLAEFKRDIDRPLAAILTLNTIAHTVGAIGVGAQAHEIYGSQGIELGGWSLSYEALIAAGATLAILVFSEIMPKTLGATYWRRFVPMTVYSLKALVWLLYPLVRLSEGITRFLKHGAKGPVFSRADFLAMTDLGHSQGGLEPREAAVIRNLLAFRDLRVREVMTPRTVLVAAQADEAVEAVLARTATELPMSRLPLYADSIDEVVGLLLRDDLLAAAAEGRGGEPVSALAREAVFVLDSMHLPAVLRLLMQARQKLAVVVDEYGATSGVVTIEDLFETLIGEEIMDEADEVADMQALARRRAARRQPPSA